MCTITSLSDNSLLSNNPNPWLFPTTITALNRQFGIVFGENFIKGGYCQAENSQGRVKLTWESCRGNLSTVNFQGGNCLQGYMFGHGIVSSSSLSFCLVWYFMPVIPEAGRGIWWLYLKYKSMQPAGGVLTEFWYCYARCDGMMPPNLIISQCIWSWK